jgi:ribose-phosphate pyrophosphokinase
MTVKNIFSGNKICVDPHQAAGKNDMESLDKYTSQFIIPEEYRRIAKQELEGPNGWLLFVACNSGIQFAQAVREQYESMMRQNKSASSRIPMLGTPKEPITTVFEDTETCPRLPTYVAGSNAYVFQSVHEDISGNTVNENIQQLLQVVRTLRAHRAKTITVVTPYSPYSRQDKPTFMKREATLASLFADQLKIAGANIHMTYHPHAYSVYGFYEPEMMFVALSGLDLFIEIFEKMRGLEDVVVVSTDAGGAKFTVHYAEAMNVSHAIVNKFRSKKDTSNILGIIGDTEGKRVAIITDDETVTGGSLLNATEQLYNNFNIDEIYVAVSHMKVKEKYIPRIIEAHEKYGLKEFHITDTIPQKESVRALDFVIQHSIAQRFAGTINRMHYNQSISKLFLSV